MRLNYPSGNYRHGLAPPFDQLFLPQSLDLSALRSNEKVWSLFDLSLSGLPKELSDRPQWTSVYYPAQVCASQKGVRPHSKRVVYCGDDADKGKRKIVPAEAHLRRKSFPGLVQVSRAGLCADVCAHGRCCVKVGAVVRLPSSAADN